MPVFNVFQNSDGNLVLIRILPDEGGKFGFNLKVNRTDKMKLLISCSLEKNLFEWSNSEMLLVV